MPSSLTYLSRETSTKSILKNKHSISLLYSKIEDEEYYKQIKADLEPLIIEILVVTGKMEPKYQRFKKKHG